MAKNLTKTQQAAAEELILQVVSSGIPKGDQKKAEILEAVVRLVANGGFESLSFDKIGKEVGSHKSHIKYHFETKEEMILKSFQYVLSYAQGCVVTELNGIPSGLSRLHAYVKGHFEWLRQKPEHLRFFFICYGRCVYDSTIREMNNIARSAGRKRILGVLQEATNLSAEDQEFWSKTFHDQITGSLVDIIGTKEEPSPYLQKQKLEETLEAFDRIWKQIN